MLNSLKSHAIVAAFVALAAIFATHSFEQSRLIQVKAELKAAQMETANARTQLEAAVLAAKTGAAHADTVYQRVIVRAPAVAVAHDSAVAAVAAAPDTCKPVIDALTLEKDLVTQQYHDADSAFHASQEALKNLTPAASAGAGALAGADTALGHASKRVGGSFLGKIVPKIGVGAYIGYDALHKTIAAGPAAFVGWTF